MSIRKLIILVMAVMATSLVRGQQCGTVVAQENMDFLQQMRSARVSSDTPPTSSAIIKIPIKFHALKNSSGEGGITTAARDALIRRLNDFYTNSNILFEHVGEVNEIVDDDNYNFDSSNEGAVAVGNDIRSTINVYFFNSINANGASLCGYTYFPPSSDRIFMSYGCITGGTLEHEIGHYFTLFHTHGTTNTGTTDEFANGSNCMTAGDRICDTPADPNLTGNVNGSCAYTGTDRDGNGDLYRPDPSNIMSYAPGRCRFRFSTGQYQRIRDGFENGRSYLNFTTEEFTAIIATDKLEECLGGSIHFDAIAFGASSYEWTFEGGTPATSSLANPIIEYSESGSFSVELKVTDNSNQEIIISKPNFVKIRDPLSNTLENTYSTSLDSSVPNEFSVENPDSGFTFEFSDIDSDDSPTSGSIFINNRGYFTENLGNVDRLFLRNYKTEGVGKFDISFDYAYTFLATDLSSAEPLPETYDSLSLQIKPQCGSEEVIIWHSGGDDLKTASSTTEPFVPSPGQWINKTFELEVDESLEFIGFEFVSHSYNGNNLYLDDIMVAPDFSVGNPVSFRLGKVEDGVPTLRWFDGSNNEVAYILERAIEDGPFEELVSLEPNTILYRDSDLVIGNSYRYRLFANGINGNRSEYTEEVVVLVSSAADDFSGQLEMYPNPTSNLLNINFTEGSPLENINLDIINTSGQMIMRSVQLQNGLNTIDISDLKSGIYFVGINKGKNPTISRIIKK